MKVFHKKGPTFWELATQALKGTTEGYDLLAPKFEYTPFRTPDELLNPLVRAVQRQPVRRALDLACGNGAISRALIPVVEDQIVGVDVSEGMLAEARTLRDELGDVGPTLEFKHQDIFTMTYEDEFDVLCTAGAFGHILHHQQDQFIERVKSALRPDGRFIFITIKKPPKSNPVWWAARGFNAAMHVRNAVIKPPFIMFYLTFTLERASEVLWRHGFDVSAEAPFAGTKHDLFRVVTARLR